MSFSGNLYRDVAQKELELEDLRERATLMSPLAWRLPDYLCQEPDIDVTFPSRLPKL